MVFTAILVSLPWSADDSAVSDKPTTPTARSFLGLYYIFRCAPQEASPRWIWDR